MAKLPALGISGALDLRGDLIVALELSEAWDEASSTAALGAVAGFVAAGAFTMPLGLPDVLDNVAGQVALFDAWSAEIEVPVYKSSDVGWDVLLNLFEATSLGIVNVEVA